MAVAAVLRAQQALGALSALMLTAYLFPRQAVVRDYQEFDFVIVGAGTAGSVIADRLSEDARRSVLVIDAGGDPPIESLVRQPHLPRDHLTTKRVAVLPGLFSYLPHTTYDWNFTSVNDHYSSQGHTIEALNLTSGRVLGGGSSVNYMIYVRGCPADFDSWAETVRDESWSYRNVLPYFIKSERLESEKILRSPDAVYHGTRGFLGVTQENRSETAQYLEAFKEAGNNIILDCNGRSSLGYTLPEYTIAEGRRQTTAYTNLGANKNRKNLHVLKNTLVTEILFDDSNNAIGVRAVVDNQRTITLLAKKEVIISAGTFNTPKLLMLSGIGPKDHLKSKNIKVRSDLPVGKNLQDHVLIILSIKMQKSNAPQEPADPHEIPVPIVTGFVALNRSKTCAEYQVFNFLIPNDSDAPYQLCAFNSGYRRSLCRRIREAGKERRTLYVNLNLLHPKSRGVVELRSKNPFDPPIIDTRTLSDERDLENLVDSMEDYTRVVNTTFFRSVGAEIVDLNIHRCKGLPFGSRRYWRCYVLYMTSTMFHYAGTCAMGSVVDGRLKVLNVRRLRVADSSVMPALPSGNTMAAVVMIAEKVSDHIKREHCGTSV